MSFATEPIQLPIVPLSVFSLHALRTNLSSKRQQLLSTGADRSARRRRRAGSAQTLEIRELAELRRQRAVQAIRPDAPATTRGTT